MKGVYDEYEKEMFNKLCSLDFNTYYTIRHDREDLYKFYVMLKKRIDNFDDFLFSDDYTKFKKVIPFSKFIQTLNNPGGISYKIECYSSEELNIDYSYLPPPVFTPANKQIKRRQ